MSSFLVSNHKKHTSQKFNAIVQSVHGYYSKLSNQLQNAVQFLRSPQIKHECIEHPFGYQYIPLLCNRILEILVLNWIAGSGSKPHSHKASINLTKVVSGQVLERKYHISGGQLMVSSERIVRQGQWAWTLPYEIHELIALDAQARTLHIYFPARC